MARISQQPVPEPMQAAFTQSGIKITRFRSVASFERCLQDFLKNNHVLHLSTVRGRQPRSTPLEYRPNGLTLYILSEGGGKFTNLRDNCTVSYSIANSSYDSAEDYWGYQGLQAWGTAKVYDRAADQDKFEAALVAMNIAASLKRLGLTQLPPGIRYRVIELMPHRIKYGNPRAGVFRTTWHRR